MALFEQEHYGKPISEKLSSYLRAYTDEHDRAEISIETRIGTSTIRDVMTRRNSLTENNAKAIVALMEVAVNNCTHRIKGAKKVKDELKHLLDKGE